MTVTVVDAGPRRVSRSVEVAAPAAELFAMAADPRRHSELDGSGTVRDNIKAPSKLAEGSKFSTKMRMLGLPYRITSTVTELKPDEVVEWRHPLGHRWRWEFESLSPTTHPGHRDLRLPLRWRTQEHPEVLRGDGFRKGQRDRYRSDVGQVARPLLGTVGHAGSVASHGTTPETQCESCSTWSLRCRWRGGVAKVE